MLFEPLTLRDVKFRNRIFVSPMCQYSAQGGLPNAWHLVHLGARAVGGAGLVIVEATAVVPEGRISLGDLGLWSEAQEKAFVGIVSFIESQGAVAGVQLAHAGRKASCLPPWQEKGRPLKAEEGAWPTVGPSAISFGHYPAPREMSRDEIESSAQDFVKAAKRALHAGFKVVELHFAHGYLAHEFLSPLSNQRQDEYGGSLENRMRFPLEIARAVRAEWPESLPLFVRISGSDWSPGGWDLDQSIALGKELKKIGVDLIDCSSGGNVAKAEIPVGPGYQVPFAEGVKKGAQMPTAAVGMITEAKQADEILKSGKADAVLLARELLRNPYWPLHAAKELGVKVKWPEQYERAQ